MTRLDEYLKSNYPAQTVKTYLFHIDVFLMRCPNANKLLYKDIIDYLARLRKEKKSINNILAAIKKYYDYLIDTGKRNDHPCRNIRLKTKRKPIQIQDLFSSEELELLLDRENRFKHLDIRNKVIISLLIYQALTSAELVGLTVKDIDLEKGTVHVKGSRKLCSRTLDLMPKQIILFQKYIYTTRSSLIKCETSKLLITHRGVAETIDGINSMIEPLKALFPYKNLNPSTIRQSVIANLLNASGKPLEAVQLFAGHKWPSSTMQYKSIDVTKQQQKINLWHPLNR